MFTRRAWLTRNAALLGALSLRRSQPYSVVSGVGRLRGRALSPASACLERALVTELVVQAVDAARGAGATYADARLTRIVEHEYGFTGGDSQWTGLWHEEEIVGVGVRALINGAWGFAASPILGTDAVVRSARAAVTQAKDSATRLSHPVVLASTPVVTGNWTTPIAVDPFAVPLDEMLDTIRHWKDSAQRAGCPMARDGEDSWMGFVRQEQVLATSEGSLITQTLYESGGKIICEVGDDDNLQGRIDGIEPAGLGWEHFLNAQIPEQLATLKDAILAQAALERHAKPSDIGRYTIVCDGATMASLLEHTLGVATQLDRALGSEANASGTSFIDDPLAMVGTLSVASPRVTVTANRSAPTQLATVRWDDEGIASSEWTLIKDGRLVDFQTTREQAMFLAPYYQAQGHLVRSNGCAAAEDAHAMTLQHMPNLALAPSASTTSLKALIADVADGILIEGGVVVACDSQARTGFMKVADAKGRQMRQITHGTLGPILRGGALQFDTQDLWNHIIAVGGASSVARIAGSRINGYGDPLLLKGEPGQGTSHSVCAAAATITNQPIIAWGKQG